MFQLGTPGYQTKEVINTSPEEWQIEGALAAFEDKLPEVQALALDKLRTFQQLCKIQKKKKYKDAELLSKIRALMENSNDNVKISALKALGDLKNIVGIEKFIPDVSSLSDYGNEFVQTAALETLGKLGKVKNSYIQK